MWAFLGGWLIGSSARRNGELAALPEDVKRQRYAALQQKRAKSKQTRALWIAAFVAFVVIYWIIRGLASLF